MRVIQIATNLNPKIGGPYQVVSKTSGLLSQFLDLELWTFGDRKQQEIKSFETNFSTWFNNPYGFFIPRFTQSQLYKLREVDALIHHGFFLFPLLLFLIIRKSRIIIMPHGCLEPYDLSQRRLLKLIFIGLIRYLAQDKVEFWVATESECKNVKKSFPHFPVYSVGLGVDLEEIESSIPNFKNSLKDEIRLIFLGRIASKKNINLIIRALKLNVMSRINLNIVGEGSKKLSEELRKLVLGLSLESRVNFKGMITGLAKFRILHESNVFVLPSDNENYAVAVAESIACLTPVVVSKDVALSAFVSSYKCGIVIESKSPDAIAEAVMQILANYDYFVNNCCNYRFLLSWQYVIQEWKVRLFE